MKNQVLVQIYFDYGNCLYTARVYKYAPTAIILPDKTVLKTNCVVVTTGPQRNPDGSSHTRQIYDRHGNLVPLNLLRKSSDWEKPIHIRFFLTFAQEI